MKKLYKLTREIVIFRWDNIKRKTKTWQNDIKEENFRDNLDGKEKFLRIKRVGSGR